MDKMVTPEIDSPVTGELLNTFVTHHRSHFPLLVRVTGWKEETSILENHFVRPSVELVIHGWTRQTKVLAKAGGLYYAVPLTYGGQFHVRAKTFSGAVQLWNVRPKSRLRVVRPDLQDPNILAVGDLLRLKRPQDDDDEYSDGDRRRFVRDTKTFLRCEKLHPGSGATTDFRIPLSCTAVFEEVLEDFPANPDSVHIRDLVKTLSYRDVEVELVIPSPDRPAKDRDLPERTSILLSDNVTEQAVYVSVESPTAPAFHLPLRTLIYVTSVRGLDKRCSPLLTKQAPKLSTLDRCVELLPPEVFDSLRPSQRSFESPDFVAEESKSMNKVVARSAQLDASSDESRTSGYPGSLSISVKPKNGPQKTSKPPTSSISARPQQSVCIQHTGTHNDHLQSQIFPVSREERRSSVSESDSSFRGFGSMHSVPVEPPSVAKPYAGHHHPANLENQSVISREGCPRYHIQTIQPNTQYIQPQTTQQQTFVHQPQLQTLEHQTHTFQPKVQSVQPLGEVHQSQNQTIQPQVQFAQAYMQSLQPQLQVTQTQLQMAQRQMQISQPQLQPQMQISQPQLQPQMQMSQPQLQPQMQISQPQLQPQMQITQFQLQPQMQISQSQLQMTQPQIQISEPQMQLVQPHIQVAHSHTQLGQQLRFQMQPQVTMAQPQLQMNQPQLQLAQPQMQLAQPQMQIVQHQMQLAQPQMQIADTQMQLSQPQMQMIQPELQMIQPQMQMIQPQMQMAQPNQPVQLQSQLTSLSTLTGPYPTSKKKGRAPAIPQTPTTLVPGPSPLSHTVAQAEIQATNHPGSQSLPLAHYSQPDPSSDTNFVDSSGWHPESHNADHLQRPQQLQQQQDPLTEVPPGFGLIPLQANGFAIPPGYVLVPISTASSSVPTQQPSLTNPKQVKFSHPGDDDESSDDEAKPEADAVAKKVAGFKLKIPDDGNLYDLSAKRFDELLTYLRIEPETMRTTKKTSLDGKKFSGLSEEDLVLRNLANPVLMHFRRLTGKQQRKVFAL